MTIERSLISLFLDNLNEGGGQRVMVNLARNFIEQGFKVDLVVNKTGGPFTQQVPSTVQVIDLGSPRLRSSVPAMMRYLKQRQPKAVLSNMHYCDEIAILAKRLSRVPTKVVVRGGNYPVKKTPPMTKPLTYLGLTPANATSLVKFFYPLADDIIAISQGVADGLAKLTNLPEERIQVIYNPVITSELCEKAKQPVEHPWFAPDELPVVLGVGRLVGQKDFPTLIRAFAQVRKTQKARLVILGSGPTKQQLESLVYELGIGEDVSFPGFMENPYAYMARSAVFVLSSVQEGFGNVLVEAMAVGTPVISTNCKSGPAEILDHGKYGWLTPVGDHQALADAIKRVLSGESKYVDPAWIQQFSLDVVAKEYLNVLGCSGV